MLSKEESSYNFNRLKEELRDLQQVTLLKPKLIAEGNSLAFLPIIHFITLEYSKEVAKFIFDLGYDLYSKNDTKFIESVFKMLKINFDYQVKITPDQFFAPGLSELKVVFCLDLIKLIKSKHRELQLLIQKEELTSPSQKYRYSDTSKEVKILSFNSPHVPHTYKTLYTEKAQNQYPNYSQTPEHYKREQNPSYARQNYSQYELNVDKSFNQQKELKKIENYEAGQSEKSNQSQEVVNKQILSMLQKFTITLDEMQSKLTKIEDTFQGQIDELKTRMSILEKTNSKETQEVIQQEDYTQGNNKKQDQLTIDQQKQLIQDKEEKQQENIEQAKEKLLLMKKQIDQKSQYDHLQQEIKQKPLRSSNYQKSSSENKFLSEQSQQKHKGNLKMKDYSQLKNEIDQSLKQASFQNTVIFKINRT